MPVLVTGATGRVGSRFVPRLLDHGVEARILVRDAERATALRERGAELVVGDLRDVEALGRAVAGVDAVVHLGAAFRGVPPEEAAAVNHTATVEIARAALRAGVARFVLVSTNLVYGPGRGRPALEDDEPRPSADSAYPVSKAAAEQALSELFRTQGLGLRIARLAFVYGDGDPHLRESVAWARRWPGHKRLHMVHHADVAQGLLRALRAEGVDGRAYNLADDAPVTATELITLTGGPSPLPAEAAGQGRRWDDPSALEDPWEGIVDNRRARAELGWRPIHPSVYAARDAGAL
jgi:nucleoside-diphosphate-sugar epimerase